MAITVQYRVHNPHTVAMMVKAQVEGQDMMVTTDGFECELRAEGDTESHGTVKLRFKGSKAAEAREYFASDALVDVTFAPAAAEAKAA